MTIRISGMASGMDIDQLVSDLMKAEKIPLTKKTKKKTTLEYKMDLYRDVNTKLMTLRDNISKIRFGADFSGVKASSSNETAVKVSGSNPSKITTTIQVEKLATQAYKTSTDKVTLNGSGLDLSKSLEDNADQFSTALDLGSSDLKMEINGVEISYSKTDTIQQIIDKVNQSGAGVALSYDSFADKFVFISRGTGEEAIIEATDISGNFLQAIQMDATPSKGQNAVVTINGITSERTSNTFTQDGITYTLLETTSSPVTIQNGVDSNALIDRIKEFVNLYNDAIELVQKLSNEKSQGYDPLTSEEKSELSAEDIKNWESMAKKGLLHNDSLLQTFTRTMRSFLSMPIPVNETDTLTPLDIGIGTTSYQNKIEFSAAGGKIVLDEDKLRKAIESNPDQVEALFTRTSTTSDEEGLLQKMYKQLNTTISAISKKAGRTGSLYNDITTELGKQTSDMELQIINLENRLTKKEEYYYKQFTAMEKAMANSNSQLNYLLQYLG